MTESVLSPKLPAWLAGGGEEGDIVLSSRIRLARNMKGLPFPDRADKDGLETVLRAAAAQLPAVAEATGKAMSLLKLADLPAVDRYVLVEKHLISPALAEAPAGRAVLISEDASVSVMVNEEDHFRLQVMRPGLDLTGALALADRVDDALEAGIDFAFDERIGYLTACPTNVGAALRASVMLHLPGLALTKQIDHMAGAAAQVGLAVRGLYGEGSEASGNLFQISNQLSLGYSEQELVENLTGMVRQIVGQERAARKRLLDRSTIAVEDLAFRAFGILSYAHRLDSGEALMLASQVRLGADLSLLPVDPALFNELVVVTRPNYVQKFFAGEDSDQGRRDVVRATMVRGKMARSKRPDGSGLVAVEETGGLVVVEEASGEAAPGEAKPKKRGTGKSAGKKSAEKKTTDDKGAAEGGAGEQAEEG